jgi:hypothetical protein
LKNLMLLVASSVVALLGLEAAARIYFGVPVFNSTNYAVERTLPGWSRDWAAAVKSIYHPVLGWTFPRSEEHNPHGLIPRRTGALPPEAGRTILAVGDSFGTGDDPEWNWPNQLEEIVGSPVVNGSTGGWGIDQIYLRIETLIPVFKPGVVIFNFIPDDVRRAELSVFYGAPKAYLDVAGDDLVLKNSPPPRYEPSRRHVGFWRAYAGHSYAVYRIALMLGLNERWQAGDLEVRREHRRGAEVGCVIMRKLKELKSRHGVREVIVFPEYAPGDLWDASGDALDNVTKSQRILRCAAEQGLAVADPAVEFNRLARTPAERERVLQRYWRHPFDSHMAAAGDRLQAEFLATFLSRPRGN